MEGEFDETVEMEIEMQNILASALTKILDQKSIRESVINLHQLVIEEVKEEINKSSGLSEAASKKLLNTLNDTKNQDSQKSILSRSLSKSMSKKGFGQSDHGFRSQAVL